MKKPISLIEVFNSKLRELQRLTSEIESLRQNPELQQEIEFQGKLKSLLDEYGISNEHAVQILMPKRLAGQGVSHEAPTHRRRQAKTYRNPHSGEVIVAKSKNHHVLKAWREQYGDEVVAGWVENAPSPVNEI